MPPDAALAQLVSAIRLRLSTRSPFFATLALFAKVEASTEIPTAATDGRDIFINPKFFDTLTPPEQEAIFLHEVLHAALLHVSRRGGRDPKVWNIAADIVVNGMLAKEGYVLPEGALRDPRRERLGVEEVYDVLLREAKPSETSAEDRDLLDGPPSDSDAAQSGKASAGALTPEARDAAEGHWRNAQEQAKLIAESTSMGKLPGGIARELSQGGAAQLDWRTYLWRYLVQTPTDFGDFDRRFVGTGTYLETLSGEMLRVAVAVDTSGSVNTEHLHLFITEVQAILSAYPHLRCDLYYADAKVYGPYALTPYSLLPPPKGGGGTDFRPFFDALALSHDPWLPTVAVYLTDGYGRFPKTAPMLPVLWVITPGGIPSSQVPFGEVARLVSGS